MNNSLNKNGLKIFKTISFIGFWFLYVYLLDYIEKIPYIGLILFFMILIYGIREITLRLISNLKYSKPNSLRLPHENDNHFKMMKSIWGISLIVLGIAFLYHNYGDQNTTIWVYFNFIIFGILLFIDGILSKNSIVINKEQNILRIINNEIKIEPTDKKIEFRKGLIEITNKEDEISKISYLDLDYNDIPNICNWINNNLKSNSVKFYRSTDSKQEQILCT